MDYRWDRLRMNMKVYFAYSKYIKHETLELFQSYFSDRKLHLNMRQLLLQLTEVNFNEAETIFSKNIKNIVKSNIFIAEISYASSGLGYEISFALTEKKQVIALYNMDEGFKEGRHIKNIPIELKGNKAKNLSILQYTPSNLANILDYTLNFVNPLLESKFNFLIPGELNQFLEWYSKDEMISKSSILRKLIELEMKKNKKYCEYLKKNKSDYGNVEFV